MSLRKMLDVMRVIIHILRPLSRAETVHFIYRKPVQKKTKNRRGTSVFQLL